MEGRWKNYKMNHRRNNCGEKTSRNTANTTEERCREISKK